MKHWLTILVVLFASSASAQSLGALARLEAVRRTEIGPAPLYTNADLRRATASASIATSPPRPIVDPAAIYAHFLARQAAREARRGPTFTVVPADPNWPFPISTRDLISQPWPTPWSVTTYVGHQDRRAVRTSRTPWTLPRRISPR